MASEPAPRLTIQEYLTFERQSESKHDFIAGEIFAMTGASRTHNLIAGNLFGELRNQLKGSACEIYTGDMRVRTPTDLFAYPDVVAVCGEPRFDDAEFDTLLNPTLIVEILSPSTMAYDRGLKAVEFRSISSLNEYVLVAQDRIHVERWLRRGPHEWLFTDLEDVAEHLDLPSIGCTLALNEIYSRVFA